LYAALEKSCLHQEPGRDYSQSTRSAVGMGHGAIIEASVTPTPRKPQGKTHDTLAPQGQEPRQRSLQPGVDKEAKWVKKGSQLQYGYKCYDLAEEDTGLVLLGHPTAARVHDGQCMASCLDRVVLPSGSRLRANTGYFSVKHDELLCPIGLRSGIQRKAYRAQPWSVEDKGYHKRTARSRYTIARVLGSRQRWFGKLEARYVGMATTHGQHVLAAIASNCYRLPGSIISNAH
jgi:transposase, IS5 family